MRHILSEYWASLKKLIPISSPIFHGTNKIVSILRDGEIRSSIEKGSSSFGGTQSGISVARDLLSAFEWGNSVIVMDKEKVSNRFSIAPVQYGGQSWKDEYEERIEAEKLPADYIEAVIMDARKVSKLYLRDWSTWEKQFGIPIIGWFGSSEYRRLRTTL